MPRMPTILGIRLKSDPVLGIHILGIPLFPHLVDLSISHYKINICESNRNKNPPAAGLATGV